MTFQDQVREFHLQCGFWVGDFGEVPPLEVRRSRAKLVWEEARELIAELLSDDPHTLMVAYDIAPPAGTDGDPMAARPPDPVKVAHEAADVHYVASGASVNFGYDETEVFRLVHAANMEKAWLADREVGDEHGKARKPVGWRSPDVELAMRPYAPPLGNVEAAARWLGEQSGHPIYEGDGWRVLLVEDAKVHHAAQHAAGRALYSNRGEDIQAARDLLLDHIREPA